MNDDQLPTAADIVQDIAGMTNALAALAQYFNWRLGSVPEALEYLGGKRGLLGPTIARYSIGIAPAVAKSLEFLQLNNLLPQTIYESGVILNQLENRITFPIYQLDGSIIGFSSRVWAAGDERSKYYNSVTSKTFWKALVLFGLYHARPSIREQDFALVVEGNLDVIKLHQAGLTQAVAPCGTAITKTQILLLKQFTKRIIFCFDADEAGENAGTRARKLCQELGLSFNPIKLEGAKDPDEFVQKYGVEPIVETIKGRLRG